MAATTSSGRKGVSRILSCSSRVVSSMFGIDSEISCREGLDETWDVPSLEKWSDQTDRTVVQSVLSEPLTSRVDPPDLWTVFLKRLGW